MCVCVLVCMCVILFWCVCMCSDNSWLSQTCGVCQHLCCWMMCTQGRNFVVVTIRQRVAASLLVVSDDSVILLPLIEQRGVNPCARQIVQISWIFCGSANYLQDWSTTRAVVLGALVGWGEQSTLNRIARQDLKCMPVRDSGWRNELLRPLLVLFVCSTLPLQVSSRKGVYSSTKLQLFPDVGGTKLVVGRPHKTRGSRFEPRARIKLQHFRV